MEKIILAELGLKFENLYDLESYFQQHYEKYSKENLVKIISEIILYVNGDQKRRDYYGDKKV